MTAELPDHHLDDGLLDELRLLLEDDFVDLLETFLDDARQRLADLQSAMAAPVPDADRLRRTAHSFKGSCLNVGAVRLAQCCRRLEDSTAEGALQQADAMVADIGQELAAVEPLLRARYLSSPN